MTGDGAWKRSAVALGATLIATMGGATGAAKASHGENGFSGNWTTNTGSVSFSVVNATSGAQELQALGGTPCAAPTTYYHGEYSDNSGSGTMAACTTESNEDLEGRYRNDNAALTFPGGDFAISLLSPSSFSGFYTADDPEFPGQFTYTGTFASHFPTDGCCDDEPPPTDGSLDPPSQLCGIDEDPGLRAVEPPARCVKRKPVSTAEKRQAREQLRTDLKGALYICGQYAAWTEAGLPYGMGWLLICLEQVKLMSDTLAIVHDPPDPRYRRIVRPRARGSGRRSGSRCSPKALCKAAQRYRRKASDAAYAAHSLALTANRHSAAVEANAVAEAFLQGAVGKVWTGELAHARAAQEAAGRRLAKQLGREDVKTTVFDGKEAKQIASEIARKRVSKQVLKRLIATGLASNTAEARKVLEAALKKVKGPVGTKALTGSLPTSGFSSNHRSMTMSELAAIVNAYAAGGELSASAQQTLVNDLVAAQAACDELEERRAALDQFITHARGAAARAAANFLALGAKPLKAATLPAASCT